jgi:hypothetical protein
MPSADTPIQLPSYINDRMSDIQSIIANIARTYSDQSCYALSYEDLRAECLAKLAKIISNEEWQKFVDKPRGEFFAYVRTVFNNHVKSTVVRYRLTSKRGYDAVRKQKNVDLNIDDYTETIQSSNAGSDGRYGSALRVLDDDSFIAPKENEQFLSDVAPLLTPIEYLVLHQILLPNHAAWLYQYALSQKVGKRIQIDKEALANGIGIFDMVVQSKDGTFHNISATRFYELVETSLKRKIGLYMSGEDAGRDTEFSTAVKNLEDVFDLQIPSALEPCVIRRIMTIAARDQFDKVDSHVIHDLETVGAIVPQRRPDGTLRCYGVLWRSNSQICKTCQLNLACKTASCNVGLDMITLSPKVLEQGAVRVPVACVNSAAPAEEKSDVNQPESVLTDAVSDNAPEDSSTINETLRVQEVTESKPCQVVQNPDIDYDSRNSQIVEYLSGALKRSKNHEDIHFQSRVIPSNLKKAPYIFVIKFSRTDLLQDIPFPLRFAKPDSSLKSKLIHHKTGYYLPGCDLDTAMTLINAHINSTSTFASE